MNNARDTGVDFGVPIPRGTPQPPVPAELMAIVGGRCCEYVEHIRALLVVLDNKTLSRDELNETVKRLEALIDLLKACSDAGFVENWYNICSDGKLLADLIPGVLEQLASRLLQLASEPRGASVGVRRVLEKLRGAAEHLLELHRIRQARNSGTLGDRWGAEYHPESDTDCDCDDIPIVIDRIEGIPIPTSGGGGSTVVRTVLSESRGVGGPAEVTSTLEFSGQPAWRQLSANKFELALCWRVEVTIPLAAHDQPKPPYEPPPAGEFWARVRPHPTPLTTILPVAHPMNSPPLLVPSLKIPGHKAGQHYELCIDERYCLRSCMSISADPMVRGRVALTLAAVNRFGHGEGQRFDSTLPYDLQPRRCSRIDLYRLLPGRQCDVEWSGQSRLCLKTDRLFESGTRPDLNASGTDGHNHVEVRLPVPLANLWNLEIEGEAGGWIEQSDIVIRFEVCLYYVIELIGLCRRGPC